MYTMRGGHVGVKVNDNIGPYFRTHKGLRHGDAPSLYYLTWPLLLWPLLWTKLDNMILSREIWEKF